MASYDKLLELDAIEALYDREYFEACNYKQRVRANVTAGLLVSFTEILFEAKDPRLELYESYVRGFTGPLADPIAVSAYVSTDYGRKLIGLDRQTIPNIIRGR